MENPEIMNNFATYVQRKMGRPFDWREGNQTQLFPQLWFHWCKTIHRNILDRIVFHSLDIVAQIMICFLISYLLYIYINRSYFSKKIITWQFFIVFLIVLTKHGPIANILNTIRIVFALIICPVVIEPTTQQF